MKNVTLKTEDNKLQIYIDGKWFCSANELIHSSVEYDKKKSDSLKNEEHSFIWDAITNHQIRKMSKK